LERGRKRVKGKEERRKGGRRIRMLQIAADIESSPD
jgi:hypothetical protein